MFEQQPPTIRQKVQTLSATADTDPTGWFEVLYDEAQGDPAQVPWAKLTPHPYLEDWLTHCPPQTGSALVVGCGLGDDAERLQHQGYQVRAFDVSPTAISWCEQRFPDSQVKYAVADLLNLEPNWRPAELVFECRNLQALPLKARLQAMAATATLVAPQGTLLVITRYRHTDAPPDGPPWPLSETELDHFGALGLTEVNRQFFQVDDPAITQVRLEYQRR